MKKLSIFFISILLVIELLAVDVSGNQSGQWSYDQSPYLVTGDVTVPLGESLTIEAGVTVEFSGDYQITAEGKMIAVGTADSLITFKANEETEEITHQGIRLEYEGPDFNEFDYCVFMNGEDGVNSIDAPVKISNSHFAYNDEGIHLFAIGNPNPPRAEITNNLIETSVKSGISIAENGNALIEDNELTGNGTGPQFRGAIQMQIQSDNSYIAPEIRSNNIHDNHYQGITSSDMFSCGTIDAQIFNNTITRNYTGVYFYNTTGTLVGNTITDNYIEGNMNSGAGVMCYAAGATPYIAQNVISGNYGGIYIASNANPIIGAPEMNHPHAIGMNHIEDNIDVNDNNNSVILNGVASDVTILAKNNFWGSTDPSVIDETITDQNDNSSLGLVEYLPLASDEELSITVNITDDNENGSPYYLSIWNLDTNIKDTQVFESPSSSNVINIEAGSYAFYAKKHGFTPFTDDVYAYAGDFDMLDIYEISPLNNNIEINLHFSDTPTPRRYKTYDSFDLNGTTVIPLWTPNQLSENVKQLIYENNDGDIMLKGYQHYTADGWQSVELEEELLYSKNNAVYNDAWTGYHVTSIDPSYPIFSKYSIHRGIINKEINGADYNVQYITTSYSSPFDHTIDSEEEYIGAIFPIHTAFYDASTILYSSYNYDIIPSDVTTDMMTLTESSEAIMIEENIGQQPTNIFRIDENLYWDQMYIFDNSADVISYRVEFSRPDLGYPNSESYPVASWEHSFEIPLRHFENQFDCIVKAIDNSNSVVGISDTIRWRPTPTSNNDVESVTLLEGNYPNPFNPETTISYNVANDSKVTIEVYNLLGQKVKTLVDDIVSHGNHSVVWNGKDDSNKQVASGVYFYKMKNGKYSKTKKMVLMK